MEWVALCAALISIVEFDRDAVSALPTGELLIILCGLIIGTVSFTGSMIAWGKLNGKVKDYSFKGQACSKPICFIFNCCGYCLLFNIS